MMTRAKILIGALAVAFAICAFGEDAPEVVCRTCNDTGSVEAQCPVCRGTRYVWTCVQGRGGWCGYGASYKPLHKNCKSSRKRIVCPNCAVKSKASATGKVTVPCPDCDGHGVLVRTYHLIRDVREVESCRAQVIRQLEHKQKCRQVQVLKMSEDELADYKIENTGCKVFESEAALLEFLRKGEEQKASAKWYFAIRDTKGITMQDRRRALEDLTRGNFFSSGDANVLKRKFTDEELADFKTLNPNCKLFRDVDEFKEFMRKAQASDR